LTAQTLSGADVAVVVIGETLDAEGKGDRANLSLAAEDIAAVDNLSHSGTPIIDYFVSVEISDLDF